MTVTDYAGWVADGSPWKASSPAMAFATACEKHGVAFGILGDHSHAVANPPEDHMPYSHTPWPGDQPYDYVLAVDLMTTDVNVANRIIAAKESGRIPCIKYMNYTNAAGQVEHISWEPTESMVSSSDTGHIHLSFRTDHTTCNHCDGFDPFTGDVSPAPNTNNGSDVNMAIWHTVQRGSKGAQVSIAQGLLIGHGYGVGSANHLPDGDFGPTTEASTRAFQTARNIEVDGIFGPQTAGEALH